MPLREWLRDELADRRTGTLELEPPARSDAPALAVALRGLFAVGLIVIAAVSLLQVARPVVALGGLAAYLAVAFVLRPRPRLDDLEPRALSWSDDNDRGLLILRLALWPGRAVGAGVRDALALVVRRGPGRRAP